MVLIFEFENLFEYKKKLRSVIDTDKSNSAMSLALQSESMLAVLLTYWRTNSNSSNELRFVTFSYENGKNNDSQPYLYKKK